MKKDTDYHTDAAAGQDKYRRPRGRIRWWKWLAAAGILVLLYAGRAVWLRGIGEFLVQPDQPEQADVIVVLAGDGYGHRLMRAVDLARQGYAKQILVDGPQVLYGVDEAEMAIQYAVRKGVPKEMLTALPMQVRSTVAEAKVIDAELRRRNARKALIVTSNFHTRRAKAVFRRFGSPEIRYRIVQARDEDFAPGDWWQSREAKKVLLLEYAKLLNWWLE